MRSQAVLAFLLDAERLEGDGGWGGSIRLAGWEKGALSAWWLPQQELGKDVEPVLAFLPEREGAPLRALYRFDATGSPSQIGGICDLTLDPYDVLDLTEARLPAWNATRLLQRAAYEAIPLGDLLDRRDDLTRWERCATQEAMNKNAQARETRSLLKRCFEQNLRGKLRSSSMTAALNAMRAVPLTRDLCQRPLAVKLETSDLNPFLEDIDR